MVATRISACELENRTLSTARFFDTERNIGALGVRPDIVVEDA
jgi:hypothetical protein